MLAEPLQQPSVVHWRLTNSMERKNCLPESLTDKQTSLSLHGDACLLTIPRHPAPTQIQPAWKQLIQLSSSGQAVELRKESQESRVQLKQGRNSDQTLVFLSSRLTHAWSHAWSIRCSQSCGSLLWSEKTKQPGGTGTAHIIKLFPSFSDVESRAPLST